MELLNTIWQYLRLVTVWDIIDVAIVSVLIFHIFKLVKGTTAEYLLRGLLVLLGALVLSDFLKLNIINYLLTSVFQIGFIALVVLFQPELRRILQQFGTTHKFKIFKSSVNDDTKELRLTIAKSVEAVNSMSWDKIGALIVFERKDNITSVTDTGTFIDAQASSELLKNIFYPKAPLHDGAVVISQGRIKAAGCILPLSANNNISKELGTRHRAALGMSENYDSIVVVVSEENSSISLAVGGVLKRHLAPETLEKLLCAELLPKVEAEEKTNIFTKLKGRGKV